MAGMLYHFLKDDYSISAFTVDSHCIKSDCFEQTSLVSFEDIESTHPPDDHKMITAVGYIEMNTIRYDRYKSAKELGYEFINYIHPSVSLKNVTLGSNNIILDHASIHPHTVIGDCNFISSNSNIGHGCQIGDACWINSGVGIGGESTVEDNCFVGINATIGQAVCLHKKTFVGANSLLDSDTEPGSVYLSSKAEKFRLNSSHFLSFSASI